VGTKQADRPLGHLDGQVPQGGDPALRLGHVLKLKEHVYPGALPAAVTGLFAALGKILTGKSAPCTNRASGKATCPATKKRRGRPGGTVRPRRGAGGERRGQRLLVLLAVR